MSPNSLDDAPNRHPVTNRPFTTVPVARCVAERMNIMNYTQLRIEAFLYGLSSGSLSPSAFTYMMKALENEYINLSSELAREFKWTALNRHGDKEIPGSSLPCWNYWLRRCDVRERVAEYQERQQQERTMKRKRRVDDGDRDIDSEGEMECKRSRMQLDSGAAVPNWEHECGGGRCGEPVYGEPEQLSKKQKKAQGRGKDRLPRTQPNSPVMNQFYIGQYLQKQHQQQPAPIQTHWTPQSATGVAPRVHVRPSPFAYHQTQHTQHQNYHRPQSQPHHQPPASPFSPQQTHYGYTYPPSPNLEDRHNLEDRRDDDDDCKSRNVQPIASSGPLSWEQKKRIWKYTMKKAWGRGVGSGCGEGGKGEGKGEGKGGCAGLASPRGTVFVV